MRECLLITPLTAVNGLLAVPTGPGLGVEIDFEAMAQFRIN